MLKRLGLFAGADASKFVPVIVTEVPATAEVGVKLVIVGVPTATTANEVLLASDPFGLVTAIAPVVAPPGTVTTNWVVAAEVIEADVPLNVTVF